MDEGVFDEDDDESSPAAAAAAVASKESSKEPKPCVKDEDVKDVKPKTEQKDVKAPADGSDRVGPLTVAGATSDLKTTSDSKTKEKPKMDHPADGNPRDESP